MPTTTLTVDTHLKLRTIGVVSARPENGFFCFLRPLPFKTNFSELPFYLNRIPLYYETRQYLEYLGFNPNKASAIFIDYQIRNRTGIINQFTLLIEAKNHIQTCSNSDTLSRKSIKEVGELGSREFIWCEKFGMTANIVQDVDILLKKAKENPGEMDRYLVGPFQSAKNYEDLVFTDFIIEVVDRRFTKLITLEKDSRKYFNQQKLDSSSK